MIPKINRPTHTSYTDLPLQQCFCTEHTDVTAEKWEMNALQTQSIETERAYQMHKYVYCEESNDIRSLCRRTRVHLSMSALDHYDTHRSLVESLWVLLSTQMETLFSGNCVEITNDHINTSSQIHIHALTASRVLMKRQLVCMRACEPAPLMWDGEWVKKHCFNEMWQKCFIMKSKHLFSFFVSEGS